MGFDEIMNEFLFKKIKAKNTKFNPGNNNSINNGIVHDSKCRILGGCVGSAGLFTCSEDINLLARSLFDKRKPLLNKEHMNKLGEITFPNSKLSCRGNLGIYVKHPDGLSETYTPSSFSKGSFSHEGYTGSVAAFDPNNLIHFNVLVDAIYDDKAKTYNDKVYGYLSELRKFELQLSNYSILLLILKKYYNNYCNETIDYKELKLL